MQEALLPNATHESVRNQFKQFGPIAYVSLPKYRVSGKIKEFAFIEFEQKSSVDRCISAFRQFDGVINSNYEANKIQSVTTYLKEQDELDQQKDAEERSLSQLDDKMDDGEKPSVSSEPPATESDVNADLECATDVSDVDSLPSTASQPPPAKRAKLMSEADESTGENESATERSNDTEKESVSMAETDGDADKQDDADFDGDESPGDQTGKRRRRKRRKAKSANIVHSSNSQDLVNPAQVVDDNQMESVNNSLKLLRVATKVEWKRLRNKYLALQREQYTQLKKFYAQQQPPSSKNSQKASTLPPLPRPVTIKSKQPSSKQICTRNINFYGANDDQSNENGANAIANDVPNDAPNDLIVPSTVSTRKKAAAATTAIEKKASATTIVATPNLSKGPLFEYEPGLIVKVGFDEPCIDVADFKAEMKQYAFVRYVDLKEGQMAAYVRVDSPHSAPHLIKHCAPRRCQILTGDVETDYWKKIAIDREAKLTKAVKMPKGRDKKMKNVLRHFAQTGKIVKAPSAINHIRFDDWIKLWESQTINV